LPHRRSERDLCGRKGERIEKRTAPARVGIPIGADPLGEEGGEKKEKEIERTGSLKKKEKKVS